MADGNDASRRSKNDLGPKYNTDPMRHDSGLPYKASVPFVERCAFCESASGFDGLCDLHRSSVADASDFSVPPISKPVSNLDEPKDQKVDVSIYPAKKTAGIAGPLSQCHSCLAFPVIESKHQISVADCMGKILV